MRTEQFQPSLDSEGRLLLLISAFSRGNRVLEGRTKLAKLDFLLRYPHYLKRALEIRKPGGGDLIDLEGTLDIEGSMVRYRYGPWDPSYYALLGRLIGKGLVQQVPYSRGLGYKQRTQGAPPPTKLVRRPAWQMVNDRLNVIYKHFNLAGTSLMKFIYNHFPEVTQATWGDRL